MQVVVAFKCSPNVRQPLVYSTFALNSFVTPVCCQTVFSNLVHPFSANLYLNPLVLGSQNSDVQTLVSITFGHTEPIAQSFRIGHIHICNDRIGLPALHFFALYRRIDDDTDGKKVVNTLKTTLLFLHLLPNRVNTFRASFHMKPKPGSLQLSLNRLDKPLDVTISCLFCGVQFIFYHVVSIVLQILQTKVF